MAGKEKKVKPDNKHVHDKPVKQGDKYVCPHCGAELPVNQPCPTCGLDVDWKRI
jgi:hypothetical protein